MPEEGALSKQRTNINVFKTVERLSKRPIIFINYLRVLAKGRGVKLQIHKTPEEKANAQTKTNNTKNAKHRANLDGQGPGPRRTRGAQPQEEHGQNRDGGKPTGPKPTLA